MTYNILSLSSPRFLEVEDIEIQLIRQKCFTFFLFILDFYCLQNDR
jgi:hypothetical protein